MNQKQNWGRKETIVWPPHAPIYTFSALGLAVLATVFFVWQHLRFSETILRRTYTPTYVQATIGAAFQQHGKYRLLFVGGPKAKPRLAMPADFAGGFTTLPDGKPGPAALSEIAKHQGYSLVFRGLERDYNDANLSRWLRDAVFEHQGIMGIYGTALAEGLAVLLISLVFAGRADVKRFRELKYGRRLKGPIMTTPAKFNRALKADGLAIQTAEKPSLFHRDTKLRIPKSAEAKHIQIMGDTGVGKSTLIKSLLKQIAERGETAIVYDPAGEFTEAFYNEKRGDWILNPLDARTPYWTPSSELRNDAEARTIAASMYQPREDKRGEFFTDTPQKIFAHLLKYRPTPQELVEWMSNEKEIDKRLKGTELANFAPKNAPQQRSGVLASLGLVADSLRLLPSAAEAEREWCATEWAEERKGWIFLTSTEAEQDVRPMLSDAAAERQAMSREFLNEAQRSAIREVLTSRDRVHGFQGLAGSGKTSTLSAIREGAEQGGYKVEGFAPTSKAAGQLREAGIEANTLQSFLARKTDADAASRHLYLLDESSLASTKQMRAFLEKIKPEDRVLVIGDTRQHQGVDAGRPFQQMQEAGMQTARLETIVRQKDPELLRAVEHLAKGETEKGIALLSAQDRITEISKGQERIDAIARDYAAKPVGTLIVSPDNRSRQQINEAVCGELQKAGKLGDDTQQFQTLSHRSDMTGPDRTWAAMYRVGDVVQYDRGSKTENIERGAFGVVRSTDAATNRLTVELGDGSSVTYDPKRVYGVNVYREVTRELATGDRIQFSAQQKELGVANRDLGTVTKIEPNRLTVQMEGKEPRSISFSPAEFRQFDHGYAVTSHSSQGLTSNRVIAHFDTDSSQSLINQRLAYVAISRASEDARIYTNNAETLGQRLSTDVTKSAALDFSQKAQQQEFIRPAQAHKPVQVHEYNNPDSRLAAVAADYAARPEKSVIVAPSREERDELTQLARADLYAQGKLGRVAHAVPVLVEKRDESRYRVEAYEPGDKIQYRKGSSIEHIPNDSQATVISTKPKGNLLTVQIDTTRDEVTYSPSQLRAQTRESRLYREEVREIAEGERIRFTSTDRETGVRQGDLGTVTRIGQDRSMTVQLDSGKTAELSPEKTQRIDYGYAVDGTQSVRADRIIATGDQLSQRNLQTVSPKAELAMYPGSAAAPEPVSAKNETVAPAIVHQQPPMQRHDYGIGF